MVETKRVFTEGIAYLNTLPEFENILITGKIMRDAKKDSYYSTVWFKGYEEDKETLYGEATIYINFKDLNTPEKIVEALAHEANHITTIKVEDGYYLSLLRKYFALAPALTEKPDTGGEGDVSMV